MFGQSILLQESLLTLWTLENLLLGLRAVSSCVTVPLQSGLGFKGPATLLALVLLQTLVNEVYVVPQSGVLPEFLSALRAGVLILRRGRSGQ